MSGAVGFNKAIENLESGEWEYMTTTSWRKTHSNIKINLREHNGRKFLRLTHRDESTTCWQITSSNIFEDRYMEVS